MKWNMIKYGIIDKIDDKWHIEGWVFEPDDLHIWWDHLPIITLL